MLISIAPLFTSKSIIKTVQLVLLSTKQWISPLPTSYLILASQSKIRVSRPNRCSSAALCISEQGFVLHENTLSADTNHPLNISTSKEILTKIGQDEGPEDYIVTLGYSGWEPGQLEKEIIANDWLVAPYNPDIILRTPPSMRWEQAAESIGININQLSGQTGHA